MGNNNQSANISSNTNNDNSNNKSKYSVSTNFGESILNENDNKLLKNALLSRLKYNVSEITQSYPCRFTNSHKKKIYKKIKTFQSTKAKIDPNKVSYFTRWKQLNNTDLYNSQSLNIISEYNTQQTTAIITNNIDNDNTQQQTTTNNNDNDDNNSDDVLAALDLPDPPTITPKVHKNDNNDIDDIDDVDVKTDNNANQSVNQKKSITIHSFEENVFEYNDNIDNQTTMSWHLNFAHSNLFVAYRGSLLAQDELQVLEHPYLGSLRECMMSLNKNKNTDVSFLSRVSKYATPCLFTNVPRQCHIDTVANKNIIGREKGLYGNAFCRCKDFNVIDSAVTLLNPIIYSNIIAIEAPTGGFGVYSLNNIDYTFYCAFTAFIAARIESEILLKKSKNDVVNVIIHTGNWGTGAYGGNKELMSLLQILAADFAGINKLIYHTFNKIYTDPYLKALKIRDKFVDKNGNILYEWNYIRNELYGMKYKWGVSDGN